MEAKKMWTELEKHQRLEGSVAKSTDPCEGVTGVILAGGQSRRMGTNKALLDVDGVPIIERIYNIMTSMFSQVVLVTNTPDDYTFLPCPRVPDIYPNVGCIAGLHTGLQVSSTDRIFIVPCDMPFLNTTIIKKMCSQTDKFDAVVPIGTRGIEPLHAVYSRSCVDQLKINIRKKRKNIVSFLREVRTRYVSVSDYQVADREPLFCNLNYPHDYESLQQPKQVLNL